MTLDGIDIHVTKMLPGGEWVQVRFPRSRRKRIRRKWAKDRRNFAFREKPIMYRMNNRIICNAAAYAKLRDIAEGRT